MSGKIGVRMHGVGLNLSCGNADLLQYTAQLFGDHARESWAQPDLDIVCEWHTLGRGGEARRNGFDVAGMESLGKHVHLGDDRLVWTEAYGDRNLQLRFALREGVPTFEVVYSFRPSTRKASKDTHLEHRRFFELVRYLVLFPIAWQLRHTRGWELIHAAALADGDRAVLLAGPSGAGRTTACVALVAQAGLTLLSENLVFCNGDLLYPVWEPVRIADESFELLGDAVGELRPFGSVGELKVKTALLPPVEVDPRGIRPGLVLLPRVTKHGYLRRIPPAVACEQLRATNLLIPEVSDFHRYAAALDLLWPRKAGATTVEDPLQRLTATTPCHDLGIDRAAGTGTVVERVLACMRTKGRTR